MCLALYAVNVAGFLLVGLALMDWVVPHDWWRGMAVGFAVLSLVTVVVFWDGLAMLFPNKIGALAVNIAVLIGLVVAGWPSEADIGF